MRGSQIFVPLEYKGRYHANLYHDDCGMENPCDVLSQLSLESYFKMDIQRESYEEFGLKIAVFYP